MRSLWRRQPTESGDEQLARVTAATAPDVATGPEADRPTQLARLRAILDLVEYYFNPHRGPLHAAIAAKVGTPDRPSSGERRTGRAAARGA